MAGFARTVLIDRPVEEVFEAERPGRGPAGLHRIVQHDRIGGRFRGCVLLAGRSASLPRGVSACACVYYL
jgi:hypothetical protein